MNLKTAPYLEQIKQWPIDGHHIMAQFDDESIVVYQSYRKEIGTFAAKNNFFGGEFSYSRMSWIKPNFLWMMFRSGWGTKPGQEVTLAIRIKRKLFDQILKNAIASTYNSSHFEDEVRWKKALKTSDVRLQWDPDHSPTGHKIKRRAIQLGLKDSTLKEYGQNPIEITDISGFVQEQRTNATPENYKNLMTPTESIYFPSSPLTTIRATD